jgi:predicted AlkP superfamily phosphohydrolase/phosphomutase
MSIKNRLRLLILGLDGLKWELLDPLLGKGVMPHLARLRREGAWGTLTSVLPTQSATAWASFITGQNPARHGVFDFMVRQTDGTYRHAKPHPETTLWHHLGRGGLQVGVLNFPVTYPPDPVNGFLVSGMLTPRGRTFTFPPSLGDELLAEVPDYRLDLEWQLYQGRERALLRDLVQMTRQRATVAHYLRDRFEPHCLAVAFIGPDRLQHALWQHLDPSHPRHDAVRAETLAGAIYAFYAALDEAVGELTTGIATSTTVLILSDHGFQSAYWQFRVDDWLAGHGWLAHQAGSSRLVRLARRLDTPWVRHVRQRLIKDVSRHLNALAPGGTIDWGRTVAFSPWNEQQAVRLNVRGREPSGVVAPGPDFERLRDEIQQALLETREPRTNMPVVDRVWKREEVYHGPFMEQMPDLIFSLRPPFAASPLHQELWGPTGWGSGDHSLEGLFVAWGEAAARGQIEGANLIDVAPTALYLLGRPVPSSMDGKVLTSALTEAFVAANPVRFEDTPLSPAAQPSTGEELTAEEQAEVQDRLRGLGYL